MRPSGAAARPGFLHRAAQFARGLHRSGEVHTGYPRVAARRTGRRLGHLAVADQRPWGPYQAADSPTSTSAAVIADTVNLAGNDSSSSPYPIHRCNDSNIS